MDEVAWIDLAYPYTAFVLAYLLGSLSFAVIVSKAMRLPDPREYGSGNPGATNVLRSGHKLAAVATLLLDAAKGYVAVSLAQHYSLRFDFDDTTIAFCGVAAFIGHLFPVFFRFQGGKGVATAAGVLLAYEPMLGVATLLIWALVALITRYSSLAAILASMFAPVFMIAYYDRPTGTLAVAVMSLLLVWRHWRNILRLTRGSEPRIGEKEQPKKRRRHRKLRSAPIGEFRPSLLDASMSTQTGEPPELLVVGSPSDPEYPGSKESH